MHLHSSAGPINVVVLNQDEGLSSLIATISDNCHQQQHSQQQHEPSSMPATQDDDMDTSAPLESSDASTSLSSNLNTVAVPVSTPEGSSVADGGSSTGTEATKRAVQAVSPASPSGMVTRRMRRQAELREGESVSVVERGGGREVVVGESVRVVERGSEKGGEGVESRDEGNSLPAVHIQVDEDQEMDIDKVSEYIHMLFWLAVYIGLYVHVHVVYVYCSFLFGPAEESPGTDSN